MIITFRLNGWLSELLMKEHNRSRTIRQALAAYYRSKGVRLWKE